MGGNICRSCQHPRQASYVNPLIIKPVNLKWPISLFGLYLSSVYRSQFQFLPRKPLIFQTNNVLMRLSVSKCLPFVRVPVILHQGPPTPVRPNLICNNPDSRYICVCIWLPIGFFLKCVEHNFSLLNCFICTDFIPNGTTWKEGEHMLKVEKSNELSLSLGIKVDMYIKL